VASNNKICKQNNIICYSIIETILYYRLLNSKLHKHLKEELEINSFVSFKYEIILKKRKPNRRYLVFIWYDLYNQEEELSIEITSESEVELQVLHMDKLQTNRRFTNRIYSDSSYRSRNDPNVSLHARI
jgi:hypothetical protein